MAIKTITEEDRFSYINIERYAPIGEQCSQCGECDVRSFEIKRNVHVCEQCYDNYLSEVKK